MSRIGPAVAVAAAFLACAPAPASSVSPPSPHASDAPVLGTRSAWVGALSTACGNAEVELVVPFYEGLRLAPAAQALKAAKSEYVDLAYPGPLSMPMFAWRCEGGDWTAVIAQDPEVTPASLSVRAGGSDLDVRLECFGPCSFRVLHAAGSWTAIASTVSDAWALRARHPSLGSRYDRYRFYVRHWVASEGADPLRTDWTAPALEQRMKDESSRTLAFVFGLDPNEVDLEGRYFWSDGARAEVASLIAANPAVAHLHWLNLRSHKFAIPMLGIDRPLSAEVRAGAKQYAGGPYEFSQYVFKAVEMCLGSESWQKSRLEELKKLVGLGFKVIALDEFPTSPKWGPEACRATNHLHRPNDFADEWRASLNLIRLVSAYAEEHGVLLTSEEPSTMLLPFVSGYTDGAFNDPPEMYEHWGKSDAVERIPLFSTIVGSQLTPYTRVGGSAPRPPKGWLVQEKISP